MLSSSQPGPNGNLITPSLFNENNVFFRSLELICIRWWLLITQVFETGAQIAADKWEIGDSQRMTICVHLLCNISVDKIAISSDQVKSLIQLKAARKFNRSTSTSIANAPLLILVYHCRFFNK